MGAVTSSWVEARLPVMLSWLELLSSYSSRQVLEALVDGVNSVLQLLLSVDDEKQSMELLRKTRGAAIADVGRAVGV